MLVSGIVLLVIWLVGFASGQAVLAPDEVASLQVIASTLGKTNWDFSVDPCSGLSGWITQNPVKSFENAVTCDCTFANNTICHVISIVLKSQNLNGSVPREITRLPFLQEIDLSRNYLNGTIPREWGSMKLVNISLLANRITGTIPVELANISTLANLTLEANQLHGGLPPELGNLPRIEKFQFTSNFFTGELPASLARLTTLREVRLGDNNFTGSIPNFIQNWTNIQKLMLQGCGLSGPIPPGIGSLINLIDLRISDLSGNVSAFPPLSNIKILKTLILRSCNIIGVLPSYIGEMRTLKVLDLTFNELSGPIPDSFVGLSKTDNVYLSGNSLNGPLPPWMLKDGDNIDLSYNNLTSDSSIGDCQQRKLNLFASSKGNTTGIVSCLKGISCERKYYYSFHINCGGQEELDDKGIQYDEDKDSSGPSNFFRSRSNWGFSNTGIFLDDDQPQDNLIVSNSSAITGPNPQLYMDARLSPLSLTYYGFCLINGIYTVTLHFAEIMFADNRTYSSLGRRMFDVYIQGELVLKDFNIENEAGGVNRALKKNFTVVVNDSTLNIRFYWAGKGTISVPTRGVYGPLISAISVDPNFTPPAERKGLPAGAIIGIVIAALLAALLVLGVVWWIVLLRRKSQMRHDLKGLDLKTGSFTLRQLKAATNDFDPANKIGEGGFGPVYKGTLLDGTIIAVKQLSSKSNQGNKEFVNEIGMISALQHPHLVKLHGCCTEGNQLLLVYEYMENNSLARALFGPDEEQIHLDWPTRHRICVGIGRGLAYLHEESRLKIVHRDIKATNVLLDKDLIPKISDFGLARLDDEENTHISTRIAGTYGYMAPEYAMHGYLTDKADVYSFGVVLLEVISGRSNTSFRTKDECSHLLELANSLNQKGDLMELVDPRLETNFNKAEVLASINVALLCTSAVAAERPNMSTVVSILEGKVAVGEFIPNMDTANESSPAKNKLRSHQSISMDAPWTASSASTTGDLYPVLLDSDFLERRH